MPSKPSLLTTALALRVRERARIAHELLGRLKNGADAGAAGAWIAELEKRAREVRSGAVSTEDWTTIRARLTQGGGTSFSFSFERENSR